MCVGLQERRLSNSPPGGGRICEPPGWASRPIYQIVSHSGVGYVEGSTCQQPCLPDTVGAFSLVLSRCQGGSAVHQ